MIARLFSTRLLWRTFRWGILASVVCGMIPSIIYSVQNLQYLAPGIVWSELGLTVVFMGAIQGLLTGVVFGIPTFLATGIFLSAVTSMRFFQPPLSTAKRWLIYLLSALYASFSLGLFVFLLISLPQVLNQPGKTLEHAVLSSMDFGIRLAPAGFWTARHVLLHAPKKKNLAARQAAKNYMGDAASPDEQEFAVAESQLQIDRDWNAAINLHL